MKIVKKAIKRLKVNNRIKRDIKAIEQLISMLNTNTSGILTRKIVELPKTLRVKYTFLLLEAATHLPIIEQRFYWYQVLLKTNNIEMMATTITYLSAKYDNISLDVFQYPGTKVISNNLNITHGCLIGTISYQTKMDFEDVDIAFAIFIGGLFNNHHTAFKVWTSMLKAKSPTELQDALFELGIEASSIFEKFITTLKAESGYLKGIKTEDIYTVFCEVADHYGWLIDMSVTLDDLDRVGYEGPDLDASNDGRVLEFKRPI